MRLDNKNARWLHMATIYQTLSNHQSPSSSHLVQCFFLGLVRYLVEAQHPRKSWTVKGPKAFEDTFLLNTRNCTKKHQTTIYSTESYTLNFKKSQLHIFISRDMTTKSKYVKTFANHTHTHTQTPTKLPAHREKQLNDLLLCDAKWHLGGHLEWQNPCIHFQ